MRLGRVAARVAWMMVACTTISGLLLAHVDRADAQPAGATPKKKKPKAAPSASVAPPAPPPEPATETTPAPPPPEPPPPVAEKDKKSEDEKPKVSNVSARVGTEMGAYTDTERVTVLTPSIYGAVYNPTGGWSVSGNYLVDVVSAASADIVSTASPRYEEVRHAGGLSAEYKPGDLGGNVYGSVSREPDYLAYTIGGASTYDIFEKNASILLGYTYGHDVAGKNSTPFEVFSRPVDTSTFKMGLSYVLNRRALLTFIYDTILQTGDTSKPYRFVPMFAPGTVVQPGASVQHVNEIRLPERASEHVPGSRNRYAFSAGFANRFEGATLRIDERLYTDSWGIKATTTDIRFLADLGQRVTLGPHVRLHAQTPVNFWQRAYVSKGVEDLPTLRTGDRELGPLTSVSGGTYLRVYVGGSGDPHKVGLGLDTYVTYTSYPDDIYLQSRLAALGAFTLEVNF